jgi:23S rRNA pseudouridine2605 synthase
MRDRPHPQHKLEWPGGVVPEWAKPKQNPNKRRGGKGGKSERQGGSSPSKRERLQKVMAQSGHGSRRNIEILIAQGHITINGQVAKLGDSVGPGDKVKLDGKLLSLRYGEPLPRVLLYHKTAGEIVTRDDPEKRPTVFDKLPKVNGGRWVSVGRLDFNTEGLLIFTTSGELANRLTHPRFEVEREYAVRVMGELTEEQSKQLLTGVDIEGESCKFDSIEDRGGEGSNRWYHVILREGKNREVRRMMETVGLMVSRLMRVRFGMVELPGHIKRGMMREMEEAQIQDLLSFAGMNEPPPAAADADEEDEFDNIGNRVPDSHPHHREPPEILDDLGNRVEAAPVENANVREPDGTRGSYDMRDRPEGSLRDGNRPPQRNQRRAGGGGGGKPFGFKGKHSQSSEANDSRGNRAPPQPGSGQGHGQGQGQGHGQGRGANKHRKHGGQGKPHGGQGKPHGGQAPAPHVPGQHAQGQHAQGQGAGQPAGQGKPGRHRRNKNRNRNRGGAEAGNRAPAAGNPSGEAGNS